MPVIVDKEGTAFIHAEYCITFQRLREIAASERWKAENGPPESAAGFIARAEVLEQLIKELEPEP